MTSFNIWSLRQALRKVWVRVLGFAALAVLSAVLAQVLSPMLPSALAVKMGADAVADILNVLASSMLAVTTFSLSVAVSALAAASGTATPRAAGLLQSDPTTQNVLATFIGAFLFSLLGLIALRADLYSRPGRVVLFLFTVAVVVLVIISLIRWIDHLMSFGRMNNTLDRVENAAAAARDRWLSNPHLGGRPFSGVVSEQFQIVRSAQSGYVVHVNMQALQTCAEAMQAKFYLDRLPGAFVSTAGSLVAIDGRQPSEAQIKAIRNAFTIGRERLFDDDPRFGLIVLSEIASRALSPGVNDPGTAISVLGRLVRILSEWKMVPADAPDYPDIHVAPIQPRDLLEDAFRPIARDGAGLVEVQIRFQKALADLQAAIPGPFDAMAAQLSEYALKQAEAAGLLAGELADLRALAPARNA